MAGPLLETKFNVPRLTRGLVSRPRLDERLSSGTESALTLVSAPAGFGKTTLLAQWLAAALVDGHCVAWLSLDIRDNDPAQFWTYFVTSLRTVADGVGAGALSLLQAPRAPVESALALLLNDLQAISHDVVLVLDDYHVIDEPAVHDGMAFLLEHLPSQLHLVIAGRADPSLPLARLRGRGELVEIRAADLRFTPDEAAAYLNEVTGLGLAADDVAALEARTEGWIAALQLAAISLRGRDDVAGFIEGFAGDDRYIVDYLVEEVLQRQPRHVREFLLQTSILERLSGPLCDSVTGRAGGKTQLAELERGNLFLVPLDDRRRWYRYHQLFADVLQTHLLDEHPDAVLSLHQRASAWFEQHDQASDAIHHALAAQDFERAADLIEVEIPVMGRSRQEAAAQRWLEALPDDVVRRRPVLSIGLVGALMSIGDLDSGRLQDAQRWLDSASDVSQMFTGEGEEMRRIPGMIEVYRGALALARGDVPGAVRHTERALDLLPEDDDLGRAAASGFIGLTSWSSGDLEASHQAWSQCAAGLRRAGHIADTLGCTIALADIRIAQGRLDEAMSSYEQALRLAPAQGGVFPRGTADMYVGMSDVIRERGGLQAAEATLLKSQELGEHAGLPQNQHRWLVAMARIREAQGDLAGALGLLNEAMRRYVGDYFPDVRPIAAQRARVLIRQGELGEAVDWAREQGLSAEDDLDYMREFEHITLARLRLAQHPTRQKRRCLDEATGLLERLMQAAEQGDRTGSVIEILVLQALAHQMRGDIAAALASLHRALALAAPQGYVRIFADEGPAMVSLLRAVGKRSGDAGPGVASSYVGRLLAATQDTGNSVPAHHDVFEPLSGRELEVLRLLGTDLDGPDIARQLFVSLNTMRTHTKNIYAKLGVNNRRAAVRRGKELNVISRTT